MKKIKQKEQFEKDIKRTLSSLFGNGYMESQRGGRIIIDKKLLHYAFEEILGRVEKDYNLNLMHQIKEVMNYKI